MAQSQLDPTGRTVRVDRLVVRTPGLTGSVVTFPTTARGLRAASGPTTTFDDALRRNAMQITDIASFDVAAGPQRTGSKGTRGGKAPEEPSIVIDAPAPAAGWEQVALAVDEHGVVTWHFGEGGARVPKRSRGVSAGTRRYVIPHHKPVGRRRSGTRRSLLGEIGKRVVKIIAFPVGRYVGRKAHELMQDWEDRHRPYGLRTFVPGQQAEPVPYLGQDDPFWRTLGGKRSLLLIHGTFSRTHSGLGAFPGDTLARLRKAYDDRVFAFDHQTIATSPADNVRWLIEHMPASAGLELDIVCHSRGGLVARALAERGSETGADGRVKVRKIALVAAPSQGTILADVDNWGRLLDTMTTLVNLVTGPGLADVIGTLLAFVRQVAVAGYPELAGLYAMVPTGPYLQELNGRARTGTYLGVSSDFEPHTDDLAALAEDEALEALHGAPNDLLVRTDSALGGQAFRKVDKQILLSGADSVDHSAYFAKADLMEEVATWLIG